MKVSRNFLQTLINYTACSSKDETRPNLMTVNFRILEVGHVELVATDGYKLVSSKHDFSTSLHDDGFVIGDYPIFADYLKVFERILKTTKEIEFYLKVDENNNIGVYSFNNSTKNLLLFSLPYTHREYPKTKIMTDRKHESKINSIKLNVKFIEDIRKAIFGSNKICGLTMEFSEMTVKFSTTILEVTHIGILMPLSK